MSFRRIVESSGKSESQLEDNSENPQSDDIHEEDDLRFSYDNQELLLSKSGNKAAELYRDLKARYSTAFILIVFLFLIDKVQAERDKTINRWSYRSAGERPKHRRQTE
jgi:hypothetical protein